MKKSLAGMLLIALSFTLLAVSALVYEQASQTTTQTIVNVASITLNNAALGSIEEGETIRYTASNTSILNDILTLTTSRAGVYLYFDTDVDLQNTNYDIFNIQVRVGDTVPGTSSYATGDLFENLSIGQPDTTSGVVLDAAGDWTFDFEILTTAKMVGSDQANTVGITVTAEDA
jgi:hypothetical protein